MSPLMLSDRHEAPAPTQVIMPTHVFLIVNLVSFGEQHVAYVPAWLQDRAASAVQVHLERTGVHIKSQGQLWTLDNFLRQEIRFCIRLRLRC